jgi:hypothetical protein
MAQTISIDGRSYNLEALPDTAKSKISSIKFVDKKIKSLVNQQAVLNRAKNGYISDLKAELMHAQSGALIKNVLADD